MDTFFNNIAKQTGWKGRQLVVLYSRPFACSVFIIIVVDEDANPHGEKAKMYAKQNGHVERKPCRTLLCVKASFLL